MVERTVTAKGHASVSKLAGLDSSTFFQEPWTAVECDHLAYLHKETAKTYSYLLLLSLQVWAEALCISTVFWRLVVVRKSR